ncbi:hypothetical protein SHOU24_70 [Vibrio phage SHOU24]|uniref:hypothetical protein n=1 Tax=Vibrio phage SHOU24 TaxID=1414739 RepID=UPI0003ED1BE8|nr:hypothetical protein SHOU24_70 [Vibrio phage SHOU24]AHI61267.1 hypothetical protein SHOU24_70 [Vibrio phage SHOU24]
MGTPRSEKGFQDAIEEINDQLVDLEQQLLDVDADSDEEADLIQKKAELSVEKATLETKFKEFLAKSQVDEGEAEQQEDSNPDEGPTPTEGGEDVVKDEELSPAEKVWPKTLEVRASDKAGYMVNPFDHTKITSDYKEVIVDAWTISQIEAGILQVKEG